MSLISTGGGKLYQPYSYEQEDEFERDLVSMADQVFGSSTLYVDIKRRVASKGIATVPDGYVVDMTQAGSPKLFVVENEIVKHDPFSHVGIQLLKFVTSFDDAKLSVRNFLMAEIQTNPEHLRRLTAGSEASATRNIDAYLDNAVYSAFRGLVVIDEARPELHHVLEKINANISVLEFRCFVSDDGDRIYEFDTLYDEYDDEGRQAAGDTRPKPGLTPELRQRRQARRALSDTVIVPAREEGFRSVFVGEDRWYSIRIGAAMKERVRYIAAYRVAPVSAVTHIAEVQDIRPYGDSGKYMLIFKSPATDIGPIKLRDPNRSPQGPVYVEREKLLQATHLEDALDAVP